MLRSAAGMFTLLACFGVRCALAQSDPLSQPPKAWATDVANNEVTVIQYEGSYLRYRMHIVNSKGDVVRDVVESRDGTVARLIRKENRALTADEDIAEQQRLKDMLDSPAAFRKHVKDDQSGKKLAVELVKLMPDAMVYTYVPGQPQRSDRDAHADDLPEVVMDFQPDPKWNPPTTAAEALTGLEGRIWVDQRTHHMTRMEGSIFRPVNLGYGMLARIFPGGKLVLEQTGVATGQPAQRWIFSHFSEHVTVRALMVKTIAENSELSASGFQLIEPMTYQDAIKTLLASPLPK